VQVQVYALITVFKKVDNALNGRVWLVVWAWRTMKAIIPFSARCMSPLQKDQQLFYEDRPKPKNKH
jgi:hypothetical protein